MTEKEILEGNKLIAEFMECELNRNKYHIPQHIQYSSFNGGSMTCDFLITMLKYHKSWDWLMSVVDKIENIELKERNFIDYFNFCIMPDCIIINKQSNEEKPMIVVNKSESVGSINHSMHIFEDKVSAVFCAVVEFIKWYQDK